MGQWLAGAILSVIPFSILFWRFFTVADLSRRHPSLFYFPQAT